MSNQPEAPPDQLQQLVNESDTGGRTPSGFSAKLIFTVAVFWSVFQLWQASPLPFSVGWGIMNDTELRSVHLGLGLFLTFLVWPAYRSAPRSRVPLYDWLLALVAAFAGAYIYLFYASLADRPGQPTTFDIVTASIGIVLLLEATRRAVGWPMAILAVLFMLYSLYGPYLPDLLAHKGVSFTRLLSHMWLSTEGVYGVALGVSASTIFVYVLFGSLLDRAGGGNYMMQVSFAALGHMRGGPAVVAVVSSGLNGLISGSSVSNVVSGGIFTIPLMKKSGYGAVKAGAIETMSSVGGQIMPPVMGAAAFLMVEYVGIPYSEVCRAAILPALLSYIGLFYIVRLEAFKLGMAPILIREKMPARIKAIRWAMGVFGTIIVSCLIYYALAFIESMLGEAAGLLIAFVMGIIYVLCVYLAAAEPDLPGDIDVKNPKALYTWPTVKAGLHFLLPIGTLIWALMVQELSPALAAFWAVAVLLALMVTQHALIAMFRHTGNIAGELRRGLLEAVIGLEGGARNMIGVAIATATAGIIVGGITLTGMGLRMTEFIEFVSQGSLMMTLLFVAFVCLVLGLGVPTTANYVLVATLMAPVVVELGAQSGVIIPLIAVHLFVFYYGIMGDITPPVGLATFAASAISGASPIATGIQGALYAMRTVILPFIWIFNPQLLLLNIHNWFELALVCMASLVAMLAFAAVTMNWFRVKCRPWELALMLAGVAFLFRPDFFMDLIAPQYKTVPGSQVFATAGKLPDGATLNMTIQGITLEGEEKTKTVGVNLGAANPDGRQRVASTGLQLTQLGDRVQVMAVRFGSTARKAGVEEGFDIAGIKVPSDRPSQYWFYIPGFLLIGLVWLLQGRRLAGNTGSRVRRQTATNRSRSV